MISLLLIVSFLLNLCLTGIVFAKNRHNRINIAFAVLAFLFSIFALSFFFYYNPIIFSSLIWIKIVYTEVSLLIVALFYFSQVFPNNSKPNLALLTFYIVANLICVAVLFTTPYYVENVVQASYGLYTITGWFYLIVAAICVPLAILPILILIRKYRTAKGLVKQQLIYVLLGAAIWAFMGIIFDAIVPIFFKTTQYFSLNSVSSIAFISLSTYAIIKHRLFDIRFVVLKTLVYSFFIAFLAVVYSLILCFLAVLFKVSIGLLNILLAVLVPFTIIFSFLFFQAIFRRISEKIFYRDRYNPQALIAKIGKIVSSNIELSHISEAVIKEFLKQIKISAGALVVSESGTVSRIRQIGEMENPSVHGQALAKLIERIVITPGENVLVRDEIAESEEKSLMEKGKYTVVLPLVIQNEIIGAIILSDKISGQVYSTEDVNILKLLAPQIAMAIKNALSYEETKDLNLMLQVRVKKATEELRKANEKLKGLDKLKDEFVSIVSHELRTPITIVKNYVWRILNDKKEGELSQKNKERLQSIYDSSEREIALINDILNVSKIEAGTMPFNPKVFDIGKLTRDVTEEIASSFTEKKLELTIKDGVYKIRADEDNIRQVLLNLLTNAVKFTDQGGKIMIDFAIKGKFVLTTVSDTGVGIRKSDFPKLFTKFGKLDNPLSASYKTTGTGLGLYLCKKMVEKSKGHIGVESEVGKGSKFIFSLPKST